MAGKKNPRKLRITLIALLGAVAALCAAFFVYTGDYYRADATALQALRADTGVTVVETATMLVFLPENQPVKAGLVFYPGGKVEFKAYAPLMVDVAGKGVACVVPKMPFNLAVFDIGAAQQAMAALPQVKTWFVGGHSLGGSMAAAWAASHAGSIRGIVFLGSYTASDLSKTGLKALCIVGSMDHVLNRDSLEKSKPKMPSASQYMEIAGGNHGQYGDYGAQKGDGTATVSAEAQQAEVAAAIADFIGKAIK